MFISIKVSASDVNDYIIRNNVKPAGEELQLGRIYNQDSSKNGNINMNYDGGKPQMIVIHDIGVDGGSINGSIDYMVRTQDSAFVHAFVDDSRLITIADKDKKSWGSGAYGNKYGIQIEQIRVAGYTAFYKQIATLANWTAQQMDKYDMGAPKLMSSPSTPQKNDLSVRPDGNLTTHKMLSYKFNQTTNHVDPDEYWARFGYDINQFRDLVSKYYNDIKTKQNIGYLDSVGITGEGNSIKVRGWHYSLKKYEYLFIMDANTGREISRQQVTAPDIRNDIKNFYNYPNAEKSGFNVTLPTPQGRDVYIMSRKTDDSRGGDIGGADDIRFTSNPITTFTNRGYLDSISLTGNTLAMRAWFWAGQSYKYQFIFALDANTGRELSRKAANMETRSDVKMSLNDLDNSEKSGIRDQLEVPIDKTIIMMIRRTNDPQGNEIGGKSDYIFGDTPISTYKGKFYQDNLSINDTVLKTHGWFWTENLTYKYQYVFVMDKNTNQELARKLTPILSRPDVKNYLGSFATADMTGFDASMEVPSNKQAYIMVRRTNDPEGNEIGGFAQVSYTDNVVNTKTAPNTQTDKVKFYQDNLSINDTVLKTHGWFWTENLTYKYQYVFVMDKNTNQELARKLTPILSRPDVKNYLGNFATADMTGFDVSMEVPSNKQAYIMVRRTNDPEGNESGGFSQVSYTDNVVNTKTAPNTQTDKVKFYQDSLSINDTVLKTRGWFWTESLTYKYQYVFVMDKNTNQELARKLTPLVSRSDVKNYLGNFATADMTGFDVSMEVPSNKQAYIMVRRTNDPEGNESGGFTQVSYTDNVVNTKTAPDPQDDRPSPTASIDLTGTNDTQKAWFNALYASAQQLAKANDLFPSVMMSQAIAESAWGQSELAKTGNNLFGVKADSSWTGAVVSRLTAENTTATNQTVTGYKTESEGRSGNPATTFVLANKGTPYYIYANFRKYASQAESLRDYVSKIKTTVNGSNYRYQGAWRSNAGSYQNAA
ncbi:glucosaminidase domain-containing protein [Lactococcus carnosus]|uniref:glucosaminidase domain-containing protein n=2 Tax=Pseudolactococcus carnosus TaxID=2749961 RepID=UPI001FB96F11|nr:glucosaminidase domain-containing protein [Lactococcus carnosus]MCJ1973627.1 hypothetical protein [Lactococcus carnosus]